MYLSILWFVTTVVFAILWLQEKEKTFPKHDFSNQLETVDPDSNVELLNDHKHVKVEWWNTYQPAISWSNLSDFSQILVQHNIGHHIAEDTLSHWERHKTLPLIDSPVVFYLLQIDHERYTNLRSSIIHRGFTPVIPDNISGTTYYHWVRRTGNHIIIKFRQKLRFYTIHKTKMYNQWAHLSVPYNTETIDGIILLNNVECETIERVPNNVDIGRGLLRIENNRWVYTSADSNVVLPYGPYIQLEDDSHIIIGFSFNSINIILYVKVGPLFHQYIIPEEKIVLEKYWNTSL